MTLDFLSQYFSGAILTWSELTLSMGGAPTALMAASMMFEPGPESAQNPPRETTSRKETGGYLR